jgi:hypothetical protein
LWMSFADFAIFLDWKIQFQLHVMFCNQSHLS